MSKQMENVQKKYEIGSVLDQQEIAGGIYDMKIKTGIVDGAVAGQFVMIYPKNKSTILPRPISICEVDREKKILRIVYRVAGSGTKEFSEYKAGDEIRVMGPLGNGFPIEKAKGKRALLLGGGIGVPPILELAKELPGEKVIVAGYRDGNLFLQEDFEKQASYLAATEDGSKGIKGNVMDAVREKEIIADVIYACGPMPMLRAIRQYAQEKNIPAFISLEERMACGVGACLGCVCKTTHKDAHSHVNNARICTDGPVFEAQEVDI